MMSVVVHTQGHAAAVQMSPFLDSFQTRKALCAIKSFWTETAGRVLVVAALVVEFHEFPNGLFHQVLCHRPKSRFA
jgi:hypothetical protein